MKGSIAGLSKSKKHSFSKYESKQLELIAGKGVEGDAHFGETVKHRSRVKRDPTQANLRQVHLMHAELFEELKQKGFDVHPGDMGENITTTNIDLLNLPTNTKLRFPSGAILKITGLRNPCSQLDNFQSGLMQAVLDKDADGKLIRKAGVMAVVEMGGFVNLGDDIEIEFPKLPYLPLEKV